MTKINPLKFIDKSFQKNPEKALAYMTVSSIVIKDGIGCYKYVTQSLNNKEIPEKRRNFVAALDLTNGILMILAQIGMFALMRKYSGPIFDKIFKKSFNPKTAMHSAEKIRMQQNKAGETVSRKIDINKTTEEVKKDFLEAFKFVAEIAAATIVGKRIIVPFVATPLANVVKDKMEARGGFGATKEDGKEADAPKENKLEKIEDKLEAKIDKLEDKVEELIEKDDD